MQLKDRMTEPRHYKADKASYVLLCAAFSPIIFMGIWSTAQSIRHWPFLACVFAAFVFVAHWLCSFDLELTKERVIYKTITGTTSLEFAKIEHASSHFEAQRGKPTVRLELHPYRYLPDAPVIINLKVFSAEAVSELLTLFAAVDPHDVE